MVRRSTWILLGILVILLAVFWAVQRTGNGPDEEIDLTPQPTAISLFESGAGQAAKVTLTGEGGRVVYEYAPDGAWSLIEPNEQLVDPASASLAVDQFFSVRVLNELDSPPPLEAIGLQPPLFTITIEMRDGSQQKMHIGAVAPTGGSYYLQNQDGQILVVSKYALDVFLDLLRDPQYMRPTSTLPPNITPLATVTPSP